jgi:hypothetical protein
VVIRYDRSGCAKAVFMLEYNCSEINQILNTMIAGFVAERVVFNGTRRSVLWR